jgi:hypothetical protein
MTSKSSAVFLDFAVVGHLAAHLGVKRGLVEHQDGLGARA